MRSPSLVLPSSGTAAPFDPLTLSPLVWLDPSDAATITLNGSNISQINDKSGNNRHYTQAVAINQPLYATGGSGINGINAIQWDGNDTLIQAGFVQAQPLTVVMVIDPATTANQQFLLLGLVGPWINGGNWSIFASGTITGPAADASLHCVIIRYSGATSYYRIDGAETALPTAGTGATTLAHELSRASSPIINGGKTGEMLLIPSSLSAPNLAALELYIKTKWGTP